jgi:hypothetical protein
MLQVAAQPNTAELVRPQSPASSLATTHSQHVELNPYKNALQPNPAQQVDPPPVQHDNARSGTPQTAPVSVPVQEIILAKQVRVSIQYPTLHRARRKIGLRPDEATPPPFVGTFAWVY